MPLGPRLLLAAAALALAGCLSAPPVDEVIGREANDVEAGPEELAAELDAALEAGAAGCDWDELADRARQAAERWPESYALQIRAAKLLFLAADRRAWAGALERGREAAGDLDALVAADERRGGAESRELLSLAEAGEGFAARAVALRPEAVGGHAYLALHLALEARAKGAQQALFENLAPRLVDAAEQALETDPTYETGGPLRFSGRFLASAPWPLRDLDKAERYLLRAEGVAPLVLHHYFLGDLYHARGDDERARAEWRAALDGTSIPETRCADAAARELARLRLAAAEEGAG